MTSAPPAGQSRPLLATITVVAALADGALTAIGTLVWNAHRNGNLTTQEAATSTLLGASAAVGVLIMVLAAVAFARGASGRRLARPASALAWLRVVAVPVALAVIGIRLGVAALAGALETFGAVIAILDALLALIVTGAALRRATRG